MWKEIYSNWMELSRLSLSRLNLSENDGDYIPVIHPTSSTAGGAGLISLPVSSITDNVRFLD